MSFRHNFATFYRIIIPAKIDGIIFFRDLSGNLFTKLDLTHLVNLEKLILDGNEKLYVNEVDRARNSRNKENQAAAINLPTGLSHL